jgi:hypothetical protein
VSDRGARFVPSRLVDSQIRRRNTRDATGYESCPRDPLVAHAAASPRDTLQPDGDQLRLSRGADDDVDDRTAGGAATPSAVARRDSLFSLPVTRGDHGTKTPGRVHPTLGAPHPRP